MPVRGTGIPNPAGDWGPMTGPGFEPPDLGWRACEWGGKGAGGGRGRRACDRLALQSMVFFWHTGRKEDPDCSPGKIRRGPGESAREISSTPAPFCSLLLPVCRPWLGFPVLLLWLGSTATLPSSSLSSDGSLVALQCGRCSGQTTRALFWRDGSGHWDPESSW